MEKNTKKGFSAKELLHHIIYPACTFFTIVMFLTNFIGTLAGRPEIVPKLSYMVLLFAFSLYIAVVNRIFYSDKLNFIVKLAVHFVACIAGFILVFILFTGYYRNTSSSVFIVFFFIVIYLLIMTVTLLIRNALKQKKIDNTPYKKQF